METNQSKFRLKTTPNKKNGFQEKENNVCDFRADLTLFVIIVVYTVINQ